jgi:hypothetical protein
MVLGKLSFLGQLQIRCKKCGGIYPSGVMMDKRTFESSGRRVYGIRRKCPFCHTENNTAECDVICPA